MLLSHTSTDNIPDILICFDESGKQNSDPIQLMGAVAIPKSIYMHKDYESFHSLNTQYRFHWTEYGGDGKARNGIIKLFKYGFPLAEFMNFNFIRYSKSSLEQQAQIYKEMYGSKQIVVSNTIYAKLPERICYGLLRGYGQHNHVQATILIEDATEYRTKKLHETIKDALNIHSLYRGEAFIVRECDYRSKGQEIGVEFIDILLGIVSTILDNPSADSKKKRAKINLVLQLLKGKHLQPFLKSLRLFELQQSNQLKEANIEASIKLFIAKNYNQYIEIEEESAYIDKQ